MSLSAIGKATGRSIHVRGRARRRRARRDAALRAPAWLIDGQLEAYASMKRDETRTVTDAVERLTGAPPRDFAQFAEEQASTWS